MLENFDWTGFFQVVLVIGGAFIGWEQRRAATNAKKIAELATASDERTKKVEAKVEQIARQTDGMLEHMRAAERRQGVLEGIAAADQAAVRSDIAVTDVVAGVVEQIKALDSSGDYEYGTFKNIDAELQKAIETLDADRTRKNGAP